MVLELQTPEQHLALTLGVVAHSEHCLAKRSFRIVEIQDVGFTDHHNSGYLALYIVEVSEYQFQCFFRRQQQSRATSEMVWSQVWIVSLRWL